MKSISKYLNQYGVLVAFVILFIANAINQPSIFLQPENLRNLVNQNLAVGILALGMTFVITLGGIDLSIGSMMAVVGTLGLLFLNRQVAGGASEVTGVLLAILVTVALGLFGGLINGLIITWGRVAPFVATLIGLLAYRSLALAMGEGGEIRNAGNSIFPGIAANGINLPVKGMNGQMLSLTWSMLIFLGMIILASFLLNKTRYGRYVIAIGANEKASTYSGISVNRIKLLTYVFMGFCVGLAALTTVSRMNSVSTGQSGQLAELDAIAAVVIGGTSLRGGSGRIWGTVVGTLLLGLINNMLVAVGVSPYWQGVVKGAVILFAVLLQRSNSDSSH